MPHVLKLLLLNFVCIMAVGLWYIGTFGPPKFSIGDYLATRSFLAQVVVLPFVETILFQTIIIESALWVGRVVFRSARQKVFLAVGACLSALAFSVTHLVLNGTFNAVVFSIVGGMSFAAIYAINRAPGKQVAFASAWLLHTAVNGLFMLSFAFFSGIFVQ